ncbi:MAG TPA: N-acetylmuramoyl-L-alanine amidase [Candidatus Obscuribacterales bacterium]
MKNGIFTRFLAARTFLVALLVSCLFLAEDASAIARTHSRSSRSAGHARTTSRGVPVNTSRRSGARGNRAQASSPRSYRSSRAHRVVQYSGRHRRHVIVGSRRGAVRGSRGRHHVARAPKPKYAYPLELFLLRAPDFDKTPLPESHAERIAHAFARGYADHHAARTLVRAGVVNYHPLRGGIFYRRQPVKYIVMHSTEPAIPLNAVRIIESWSSMGRRHPGAQYVVDRDGTIYQCVDPDLATVHVNIFKTLPGINNDNSIGIEMCHTGRQDYPQKQRDAVIKLVSYLQDRYQVADENVITHRYAQQGDHTDPVHFDWEQFLADKDNFRRKAIAYKINRLKDEAREWKEPETASATTILQPHPAEPPEKVKPIETPQGAPAIRSLRSEPDVMRHGGIGDGGSTNGALQLRGPIEVDAGSASQLNSPPADGQDSPVDGSPGEPFDIEPKKKEPGSIKTTPERREESLSKPSARLAQPESGNLLQPAPAPLKPRAEMAAPPNPQPRMAPARIAQPRAEAPANGTPSSRTGKIEPPPAAAVKPAPAPAAKSVVPPKAPPSMTKVSEGEEASTSAGEPARKPSFFQRMRKYIREKLD